MKKNYLRKLILSFAFVLFCFLLNGQSMFYYPHKVKNVNYPMYNDGSIHLYTYNIANPTSYLWSTGETTKNIYNLIPGEYYVTMTYASQPTEVDTFEIKETNNHYIFPWASPNLNLQHTINIPGGNAVTIKGQNLLPGDEIGVFYDSLNHWACAGSIVWNGNPQTITISGDTSGNSGFDENEIFRFLIRSTLYGFDFIPNVVYDLSGTYSDDSSFVIGGSSSLLSLQADSLVLQSSLLTAYGVNDFYAWVNPIYPQTTSIFPLGQSLNMLKNQQGHVFWTLFWLDNIHYIIPNEPYTAEMHYTNVIQFEGYLLNSTMSSVFVNTCYNTQDGYIYLTPTFGTPPYTYLWNTGATINPLYDIPANTNFSVTVTDALMVQNTSSITSYYGNEYPVLDFTLVDETPYYLGSAQVDVISFWGWGYQYDWSNGGINSLNDSLSAGTYNLTIETNYGCTFDTSVTVGFSAFNLFIQTTSVSCYGGNDGAVFFDSINGVPPYSYLWSTGNTGSSLSALAADNYSVTVIDSNFDTVVGTFEILQPDTISIISVTYHATPVLGNDGEIFIGISGGTTPYSVQWSNGANTENISSLIPGTYTLTIADANSCSHIESFVVSTLLTNPLSANGTIINSNCGGSCSGAIDITVSGGLTPYNYLWSNGETSEDLTNLCSGYYTVTVSEYQAPSGPLWPWNYINTGIVHTISIPGISILAQSNSYVGVFYMDNGILECGGYTEWNGLSTNIIAFGDDPLTPDKDGFAPNESFIYKRWNNGIHYNLNPLYTVNSSQSGNFIENSISYVGLLNHPESESLSFTIYEPDSISVSAVINHETQIIGNNGAIDLTMSGGIPPYSLQWSNGETTEDLTNLSQGLYILTITDSYSCQYIDTFEILLTNPPYCDLSLISIVSPQTHCDFNNMVYVSVELTNIGTQSANNFNISYISPDGTVITETVNISIQPSDTIIYTFSTPFDGQLYDNEENISITVYSSSPCDPISFNDTISIAFANSFPVFTLQNDVQNNCIGNISIDSIFSNSGNALNYYWDNVAYGSNLFLDSLCAGNYMLFIDDGICIDSFVFEIENILINIQFTAISPTCNGMSDGSIDANLNYNPGNSFTFLWSSGDTDSEISALPAGMYSLTINNNSNFVTSDSVELINPPAMSISSVVQDANSPSIQDGSINISVSGGIPPFSYVWSNGSPSEDISNLDAGYYGCTITDSYGCSNSESYVIDYINPPPPLSTVATILSPGCPGSCDGEIDLNTSGGTNPYNYIWSNGSTTEDISGLCAGDYTVSVYEEGLTEAGTPWPWTYISTWQNHTVLIPDSSVYLNGLIVPIGSYIGVFYDDNGVWECGGYLELTSGNNALTIWGDEIGTPDKEGFTIGETFSWQIYINGSTYFLTPEYMFTMPNYGSFVENGISGVVSLQAPVIASLVDTFTVDPPDSAVINSVVTNVIPTLGNNGLIDVIVLGGTPPFSFLWSNGATTEDLINIGIGQYSLTITDDNGCTFNDSFLIEYSSPPTALLVTEIVENISCNSICDGSIDISVSGGAAPYTFFWTNGETTEYLDLLCAGNYSLTVSCPSDTVMFNFTVTQPDSLDFDTNITFIDPTIGNDGAIDLIPSGGTIPYNFIWSNSETTEDIFNLTYGQYYLTLTDANSCELTADFMIEYLGNYLGFDIIKENVDCYNTVTGSAWIENLIGVDPFSFLWSNGETTDSIFNLSVGNYYVTVSAANGDMVSDTFEILQPDELTIDFLITPADPALLSNGAINITVIGGTSPFVFQWSDGSTSEDLASAEYGAYQLTITDANLCELIADTFVDFNLLPNWNFDLFGATHSIDIPAGALLQINGSSLEMCDFIGVFFDSLGTLSCGGYIIWKQNTVTLFAYGDNPGNTIIDGFANGEEFEWKIWDASNNSEHLAAASYNQSYPNQELWQAGGQSAIDSLQTITISGTVSTINKSNVPLGMIVLYEPAQSLYYAVDKGLVTNGQFKIEGIFPGDYLLYAIPAPGNQYGIPGYYVEHNNWQEASLVQAYAYTDGVDIIIDPTQTYNTGIGAISGNIYVGSDASYNPDVFGDEWFPESTKEGEIPARNIPVLLFDNQMIPMDFRLSNDLGAFEFEQLELGSYFVKVEKAGLQSLEVLVTLSESSPISGGNNFSLESGFVNSIPELNEIAEFSIFPNPVKDKLYIQFRQNHISDFEISIFSALGLKMKTLDFSTELSNQEISIDMKTFSPGVYFVEIGNTEHKYVRKIVVF
ncbi:MAG: T9SS type A sorting domain-containing protein [Bacteroidetes bacterium]|jgi:hypothetical protein|nr:T9SS type A sorting domain-containing protein [Bacteroidota bacterium]MBT6685553.1 T9SS type A sorting domain-containing protein [Bacteroidota bacterium]MBT7142263.1 T9SS type A sorting domain-containing protein [Bacteroidota bacterium]MBT7490147.1 T9SS type A sorting domain-containing protein [Bacteroidota bacterium]